MRSFRKTVNGCARSGNRQDGIALVTALLLLALLTGLSIAMYLSVNSDMLTNGYYRSFRASFYAADSGLSIVRQDMANRLLTKIDAGTNANVQPFTTTSVSATLAALKTAWGSSATTLNTGSASGSVPAKFTIDQNSFTLVPQLPCVKNDGLSTYTCTMNYRMVSIGQAEGSQKNKVEESGSLVVTVPYANTRPSKFSGYGLYIQDQDVCSGSSFAPGTITGPVFTGGCFTFGTSGNYIFTNNVGCAGAKAGYQFNSQCYQSAKSSYTSGSGNNKTTIAPTFQGGISFNADMPDLPQSDFQQKKAVIDGIGQTDATAADMAKLRNIYGTNYTSGTSSGVFFNYSNDLTTFDGGGFYVEGNADVALSTAMVPALTGSDPKSGLPYPACPGGTPNCYLQQIYKITQGGTVTTIKVTAVPNGNYNKDFPNDPNTGYTVTGVGKTEVTIGSKTLTIPDIPVQKDDTGMYDLNNATMLYVDGQVKSLSGQIQDDTALTVTAASDITVNGNLTYKTSPVSKTTDDSLIDGNDRGQVLGLYTNSGDLQLNLPSSGPLEIDASIATISGKNNANGGLTSIGKDITKLTIVGGRIHNKIYTANVASRDVYFDKRFGNGSAPPFFPSTTPPNTIPPTDTPSVVFDRQRWINQTSY